MELELTISESVTSVSLRRGAEAKGLRPVTLRLWSQEWALHLSVPGPEELARFVESREEVDLYRRGRDLLVGTGGEGEPGRVPVVGLAQQLREALMRLPEVASAREGYSDLCQAARIGGKPLDDYLDRVVAAFVRMQDRYVAPRPVKTREPAMSDRDRQRASRARREAETPESVRWALSAALLEGELIDGERITGEHLHGLVSDVLEDVCNRYDRVVLRPDPDKDKELYWASRAERQEAWEEQRQEWEPPAPRRPRPVTLRAFYKVLRSPAFGWIEGRTGGAVTFVVGAVPEGDE